MARARGCWPRCAHEALTPGTALALGTRLRETYPAGLVAAALAQHELRLAARAKFSRAMDMFFTRAGLEQASAEVVAQHRQARFAEAGLLADLCCGIGGDLIALAGKHQVRAVDRDALHLRMAMLNAAACGVGRCAQAVQADVREADLAGVDAVFIDPGPAYRRPPAGPRRERTVPGLVPGPGRARPRDGYQGGPRDRAGRGTRRLGTGVRRRRAGPEGSGGLVAVPGRPGHPGHHPARRPHAHPAGQARRSRWPRPARSSSTRTPR